MKNSLILMKSLVTETSLGVRAKHAPPANHFATRKLESTEPHQLLLNHIAQLLDCSRASKLSISGPLLHVVQVFWSPLDAHIPYLVELEPYWQVYFLGGVYPASLSSFSLGASIPVDFAHHICPRSQPNTAFYRHFCCTFWARRAAGIDFRHSTMSLA